MKNCPPLLTDGTIIIVWKSNEKLSSPTVCVAPQPCGALMDQSCPLREFHLALYSSHVHILFLRFAHFVLFVLLCKKLKKGEMILTLIGDIFLSFYEA